MSLHKSLRKVRSIKNRLEAELNNKHSIQISNFRMLNQLLSPVRNQRDVGACAFVAAVVSVEMHYRYLNIEINRAKDYCFDVVDIVDNLYSVPPLFPDAEALKRDVLCLDGADITDVLWYIREYGLRASSICTNPLERNTLAHFTPDERYRIHSYKSIKLRQAIRYLRSLPVIARMISYESFFHLKNKAYYRGPSKKEIKDVDTEILGHHFVVIVGLVKVKHRGVTHRCAIVQNSGGRKFGFKGFLVMPLDCLNVFDNEFWVPVVQP